MFSSRVPSELVQQESKVAAESDAYIADYNIYMGNLLNKDNEKLFPENMVLLSHWNLRDEIKANYANKEVGFEKMNTAIQRAFSSGMQIPQPEVQKLFNEFLSSSQIQEVAAIIKKRLGRELSPWDIWYDGFKARSSFNEEMLNSITEKKYPDAKALEADLENLLLKLGFTNEKAEFIASRVSVDPARGSGHAWGASMKSEKAHLRTRIPASGMNYKGYNIAVHEFGHNVEQTISLNDVPNYMINGVPNTAFQNP